MRFYTEAVSIILGATLTNVILSATAAETPRLSLETTPAGLRFSWHGTTQNPDGSINRPYFELQQSLDLRRWRPVGERQRASSAGESLRMTLGVEQPQAFYRLLSVTPQGEQRLGSEGAEVFGYGEAFAKSLRSIQQITSQEFAAMFPSGANYLPGLSWDPTKAPFWDAFNADPDVVNQGKDPGSPGYRTLDYRLSGAESAVFQTNGFVVSERLGGWSFGEVFYALWHNDLPVFISTDAILQAWHRTYDEMLEEIEETYLFSGMEAMLDGMAGQIANSSVEIGAGALRDSLLDADFFVAVARSLLAGRLVPTQLGQDTLVQQTLADIQAEALKQVSDFMGFCRMVDYSQFKVRGHYENSERLGRYFKCLMWLGRIDAPLAGGPFRRCPFVERSASPRELGLAVVLLHLLNSGGQFELWENMHRVIETFVGWTDSMTFGQLKGVLAGAGIRTPGDVADLATLERLQADMVEGDLGQQNITSDWFAQPFDTSVRYALPRTFTVFGQRFVPDSWAMSQTVYNNIEWVEAGVTNRVLRRVPGALDVAFAVLGNNEVVPNLTEQMKGTFLDPDRPHALKFRDRRPYQHNLAAVRSVIDSQSPDSWDSSIYQGWLACLRELSVPTSEAMFPEAMRTRSWGMKTLNTQLASWTQLRHDTILYAKQSYTWSMDLCQYPEGFVEPRVQFWQRLGTLANRTADLIAELSFPGHYPLVTNFWRPGPMDSEGEWVTDTNFVPLVTIQDKQINHLRQFADVVKRLETMSRKELAGECFGEDENLFVHNLLQLVDWLPAGCTSIPKYDGWYLNLFYRAVYRADWFFHEMFGALSPTALVADVHTDVPCPSDECENDPGSVLHQAVGRINLLMIAVDNGPDRFVCAGPVLSHYEFEVLGEPRRISDNEWTGGRGSRASILDRVFPADVPRIRIEGLNPPVWTRSYLVPW